MNASITTNYRGWPVTDRGITKTDTLAISPDGPFVSAKITEMLETELQHFQKCLEYEKNANIRLEKEIKRLRESLMDIGEKFHAVEGITMIVNAALHPLPNV